MGIFWIGCSSNNSFMDSSHAIPATKSSPRNQILAPYATTGQTPAVLFFGCTLRTCMDLIKSEDVSSKVSEKQRAAFDPTYRMFSPGQSIFFLSGNPRMDKWVPGTIITRLGDLHYEVDFFGRQFKRHIDQIRGHETS